MTDAEKYQALIEKLATKKFAAEAKKLAESADYAWILDEYAPGTVVGLVKIENGQPSNNAALVLYVDEEDYEYDMDLF